MYLQLPVHCEVSKVNNRLQRYGIFSVCWRDNVAVLADKVTCDILTVVFSWFFDVCHNVSVWYWVALSGDFRVPWGFCPGRSWSEGPAVAIPGADGGMSRRGLPRRDIDSFPGVCPASRRRAGHHLRATSAPSPRDLDTFCGRVSGEPKASRTPSPRDLGTIPARPRYVLRASVRRAVGEPGTISARPRHIRRACVRRAEGEPDTIPALHRHDLHTTHARPRYIKFTAVIPSHRGN